MAFAPLDLTLPHLVRQLGQQPAVRERVVAELDQRAHLPDQRRLEARLGRRIGRQRVEMFLDVPHDAVRAVLHHDVDQFLLRREVIVDAGRLDPGLVGDGPHRRRGIALRRKGARGKPQQGFPGIRAGIYISLSHVRVSAVRCYQDEVKRSGCRMSDAWPRGVVEGAARVIVRLPFRCADGGRRRVFVSPGTA